MPKDNTRTLLFIMFLFLFFMPLIWLTAHLQLPELGPVLSGNVGSFVDNEPKDEAKPAEAKRMPTRAYEAQLVGQSHDNIRIKEDEELRLWVDFKNVGKETWKNSGDREFLALNAYGPMDRESLFKAPQWEYKPNSKSYRPGVMSHGIVGPGDVGRFYIDLHAPDKTGTYTEKFKLVSEWREWVEGGDVTINIIVDPSIRQPLPKNSGEMLRIGVHKPENASDPISISSGGAFEIRDLHDNLVALYNKDEIIKVEYINGTYHITAPAAPHGVYDPTGWHHSTKSFLKFIPKEKAMYILEIDERPSWNVAFNYNRFVGNITVRHAEKTGNTWVINTVPMEAYLRGTHEVSNYDNFEYIKSFIVAERTFAQEVLNRGGKYYNGNFDLTRWSMDQVYHGFNYELQSPNVTKAVIETSGEMVTYDNKVVTTPYFARSDGRTRSNEDVWYGKKPWLVGKDDPAGKEQTMWGHGVGMSANGANYFAKKGWNYKKILQYYYTGVKIKDFY